MGLSISLIFSNSRFSKTVAYGFVLVFPLNPLPLLQFMVLYFNIENGYPADIFKGEDFQVSLVVPIFFYGLVSLTIGVLYTTWPTTWYRSPGPPPVPGLAAFTREFFSGSGPKVPILYRRLFSSPLQRSVEPHEVTLTKFIMIKFYLIHAYTQIRCLYTL